VPPRSIVRIAADGWSATTIRTVIQNISMPRLPDGVRRWWFFDEITGTSGDWASQVKWLRDNDPGFSSDTVVLTGSNAQALTAAAGVLAGSRGRVTRADRTLMPIGFRTFVSLLAPEVETLAALPVDQLHTPVGSYAYNDALPWLSDLVRLWELYLSYGGFPVAVASARSGDDIPRWFLDDLFNVMFKDAFAATSLSETTTMALVSRIMTAMASPLNLQSVGRDVQVSQDIASRHAAYLRVAYLTWQCPQRNEKAWTPRLRSQDKVYAIDPVIARLSRLRNPSRADIDPTVLTEMQIGMALRRTTDCWTDDESIFHQRTATRKGIDFVSERFAGTAVEGKYTDGVWRSEAATVAASAYDGVLTTRSVLDTTDQGGPWAVPAAVLAYLIDT
jgi:uncharacterized protein